MQIDTEKILSNCIKRWSPDEDPDDRLEYFRNQFSEWFSKIPENTQSIVSHLLELFDYYSHKKTNMYLSQLHDKLIQKHPNLNTNNTIYSFIKPKNETSNSSIDYWVEYRIINKLSPRVCIIDIKKLGKKQNALDNIDNFVFIDDCCGSGKSLSDFLEKDIDLYYNKSIFVVVIHIMESAIFNLIDFATKYNFKIYFIYINVTTKAFSLLSNNILAKQLFEETSRSLQIPDNEILGYSKSESLMAFHNNTPNNTLGLFRYKTGENHAVFPRNEFATPSWWGMNGDAKKQKISNYNTNVGTKYD